MDSLILGKQYADSTIQKFYYIGFAFVILSGLRVPFLPELQLIILAISVLYTRKLDFRIILLLATILCTHHYVIPDFVYRADGSDYPSIYTRAYGGVKILDVLVCFVFALSLPLFIRRNILKIFYMKGLPNILLFTSFIGIFFLSHQEVAVDQALFIIRSYLLFFAIFIICVALTKEQFLELSKLIIFCWILKMVIAILIPHSHPLARSILGFNGIIFFAGDEYMSLPLYFAIILVIRGMNANFSKIYIMLFFILLLTMIAQRKGALQILLPFTALVWCYQHKSKLGIGILKFYYVLSAFILFFFLLNIKQLTSDPLILLAFREYSAFAEISIDSLEFLYKTNPLGFIFGISPFGKYEIIGLPAEMDHMMSFGKEVGEVFRYQFWSFPLGRCILNVGLIGFIYVLFYYFKACKYSAFIFFLIISSISICYYTNLTPVMAFAQGIVFAFLYNQMSKHRNNFQYKISS